MQERKAADLSLIHICLAGNAALKDSVRLMLGSRRLTHSVLLVGETGLGAGDVYKRQLHHIGDF